MTCASCWSPNRRTVDPELMMGMLFKNSDLETRFSLNMNVLIDGVTPMVCSLREVLRAFLDHRRAVLQRRSQHRLDKIDHRLEVLEGFIIAFLNLDRVIDIIRYDEGPRAALMREVWGRDFTRATSEKDYVSPPEGEGELSELQAESILNMRLRSLRRLEEMELRRERDDLLKERAGLEDLLGSDSLQWKRIDRIARRAGGIRQGHRSGPPPHRFRAGRRGRGRAAGSHDRARTGHHRLLENGLDRAMKGHVALDQAFKFKDGDEGRFAFHAETTDKIVLFGSNGRFYTLLVANLPGGRGMGEPVRLMVDLPNEAAIVDLFIHKPGVKLVVASSAGDGFVVPADEVIAQTRGGKQVLNVKGGARALVCRRLRATIWPAWAKTANCWSSADR